MGKKWRTDLERNAFFLSKKVDRAVREHQMISEGDRVLVGLSGGKDSLGLLHLLVYAQARSPVKFEVVAAHVRGDARGPELGVSGQGVAETTLGGGPAPGVSGQGVAETTLARWVESLGVDFHTRDIILPEDEPLPMDCERCSRNRRRTLFEIAREMGCNKLALGHNLEDFAHTALMNLLQFGRLETMAFSRRYFSGLVSVIRPLAYVRENDLVRLARSGAFPIIETQCPLANATRRQSARDLMRQVSVEFRHASENIVRAASTVGEEP